VKHFFMTPGLTHKLYTRLERHARDKHSSLLRTLIIYSCKSFITIGQSDDRIKLFCHLQHSGKISWRVCSLQTLSAQSIVFSKGRCMAVFSAIWCVPCIGLNSLSGENTLAYFDLRYYPSIFAVECPPVFRSREKLLPTLPLLCKKRRKKFCSIGHIEGSVGNNFSLDLKTRGHSTEKILG
jgi:hypothetical protein